VPISSRSLYEKVGSGVPVQALTARTRLLESLRWLPPAFPAAAAVADVPLARPGWWPGRFACMETFLATVLAIARCGRRAHWVLGARRLRCEAHAWVWTPHGAYGLSGLDTDDARRPWVGVHAIPHLSNSPERVY
jgi:hypothetical protein